MLIPINKAKNKNIWNESEYKIEKAKLTEIKNKSTKNYKTKIENE